MVGGALPSVLNTGKYPAREVLNLRSACVSIAAWPRAHRPREKMGVDSALLIDEAKDMKRKIEKPGVDHEVVCDVLQNLMEREVTIKVRVKGCSHSYSSFGSTYMPLMCVLIHNSFLRRRS
jgi:hypothetical protein